MKKETSRPKAGSSMPAKSVFLVDDHPMMRDGLVRLIGAEAGLHYCGGAASAEQALGEIMRVKPDLVITDITLGGRSGLDLIKDIKAALPEVSVLVFSMHDEMFYAERALRSGARGYLMKEAGGEKLLEAIHKVLAGETYVSPKIALKIVELFSDRKPRKSASPVELLTDREFEVYQLVGHGKSTKEIASQLHLSEKTVAVHRGNIKQKLRLDSATELVHNAIRWVETQGAG